MNNESEFRRVFLNHDGGHFTGFRRGLHDDLNSHLSVLGRYRGQLDASRGCVAELMAVTMEEARAVARRRPLPRNVADIHATPLATRTLWRLLGLALLGMVATSVGRSS